MDDAALLGIMGTVIGTIMGLLGNYLLVVLPGQEADRKRRQRELIGQLHGAHTELLSFMGLMHQTHVHQLFWDLLWVKSNRTNESAKGQMEAWRLKNEQVMMRFVEAHRNYHQLLGAVGVDFILSEEDRKAKRALLDYDVPEAPSPIEDPTWNQPNPSWPDRATVALHKKAADEFGKPSAAFLERLEALLH